MMFLSISVTRKKKIRQTYIFRYLGTYALPAACLLKEGQPGSVSLQSELLFSQSCKCMIVFTSSYKSLRSIRACPGTTIEVLYLGYLDRRLGCLDPDYYVHLSRHFTFYLGRRAGSHSREETFNQTFYICIQSEDTQGNIRQSFCPWCLTATLRVC